MNTSKIFGLLVILASMPYVCAMVFIGSPIAENMSIGFKLYFPFYFFLFLINQIIFKIPTSKNLFIFISLILITNLIVVLYHADFDIFFFGANIVISILIFLSINENFFKIIVKISTLFIFIALISALISFIFVLLDGHSTKAYITKGGRELSKSILSLGTLNTYGVGYTYLRPSFIYDEPGAFSFVIVFIAALRNVFNLNKKITWVILIMGLVTVSLAHLIYIFFHYLSEKRKIRNSLFILITSLTIFYVVLFLFKINLADILLILNERLTFTSLSKGIVEGNNRFEYLQISLSQISNYNIFDILFGTSKIAEGCCNPFYPMAQLGILGSWPYYVIIFIFIIFSFKLKSPILFGISLILFQRPEVSTSGSSFLVAALLVAILRNHQIKINKK